MNSVCIELRATYDPDFKTIGDTSVCVISCAFTEAFVKGQQKSGFVTLKAWGRLAEICRDSIHKGDAFHCTCHLGFEQWEKDGAKHQKNILIADAIHLPRRGTAQARD